MTRSRLTALAVGGAAIALAGGIAIAAAPFAGVAILGAGLVVAGVAVLVAVATAWAWLSRSNPMLDGEVRLAGITSRVTIRRDELGTPHIAAESLRDAGFGLGVVMAQDRLWQMDLLRRAAAGRLAEVAGPEALSVDAYARTIGLRRSAEADEPRLGEDERELLRAFSAGVNAVIGGRLGGIPFEFRLLRYAPEAWTVADSLSIAKALGWLLSSSLEASILAWRLTERIGPELAAMLFDAPPSVAAGPAGPGLDRLADLEKTLRETIAGPATAAGSNVWAVSGSHTRSGKPILANDVHLGNEYSLRFYEARVTCTAFEVSGLFVPGGPLAVAGTNGTIAWGPTNTGVALSDVYIEELSDDGTRARHGDSWEEIVTDVEEISVRGASARRLEVRRTRHGPIVSDLVPSAAPREGTALSLRWAGRELASPAPALLGIGRARDWESFNAACDAWTVPATTLGYADGDGHIGLRVAGAIPARPRTGLLALDGTDPSMEWDGFLPASENPRVLDPPEGWIASANDAPATPATPAAPGSTTPVTWLPEPPYRLRRIREMLSALVERGRSLTEVEMMLVQRDTLSAQALELLPRMVADLDRAALDPAETEALRHLEDWNGNVTVDSVAASIWEAWYQRWLVRLLEERLEPSEVAQALEMPRLNPGHIPWSLADRESLAAWCRDEPAALLTASFREAVGGLARERGRDPSGWDWGSVHTATWTHPAAGSRVLAWLLNRGPFAVPGDAMTVNAGEFRLSKPYAAILMPISRMVIDLGAPESPRFSTHPGQSGHPLSPHYDDRLSEFRRGESHVTQADPEPARVRHTLTLVPA